jgi:uncharacterized protein
MALSFAESKRDTPTHPLIDSPAHRTDMNPEHLQLLVTRVMPYGKYQGRLIADLPGHYLNWFAREGFPRGEIGTLLALMQELDHNGLRSLLDPLRDSAKR